MTDPEIADATYIEPLTPETVERIIARERPDALLPTMGGQTALNIATSLYLSGALEKYGVELIGASFEAIDRAEDRGRFQEIVRQAGLDLPRGKTARTLEDAEAAATWIGFPVIIRPAYTLGGSGGSVAYNIQEFRTLAQTGLSISPVSEILIEESLIGWKEFELEVMRDRVDNAVVVCSIENFDPLGVHTGDSITVAPAQTLTDKEYQLMRDAALAVMRAVGVESGGSNIQFGLHPKTGRMVVIEMNPRVSRSSALASKATGFPIAKIAAQLAVGLTLGEIPNDVTGRTVSAFEPTLDYVVVKIPRWAFEKFPAANRTLGMQMKSVGEVMAIGRTFREALQKAVRSLDIGRGGLGSDGMDAFLIGNIESHLRDEWREIFLRKLRIPSPDRLFLLRYALALEIPLPTLHNATGVDPWFLRQMQELLHIERELGHCQISAFAEPFTDRRSDEVLLEAKRNGFSDRQIAHIRHSTETSVRSRRQELGMHPAYRTVDTCAAEFAAQTPYFYSTYGEENEAEALTIWEKDRKGEDNPPLPPPSIEGGESKLPGKIEAGESDLPVTLEGGGSSFVPSIWEKDRRGEDNPPLPPPQAVGGKSRTVVILGSGPNRIGQGIEFDYCCVQAVTELRKIGYKVVMVNSNPETVSTDYDIADRLYFEPLTAEDLIGICDLEKPFGVALQFGGGTPLKLAGPLQRAGVPILGTSQDSIDLTEDRARFAGLLAENGITCPPFGTANSVDQALVVAERIGYPVLVRPSYVLGGRAMEIVYDPQRLREFYEEASQASDGSPVLVDRFIEDAFEFDIDAVADGSTCLICGIMQHIEEAGIHSGDSACVLPPYMLSEAVRAEMIGITKLLAIKLKVKGLMNLQFALQGGELYVLEVNPRASRTIPFVSKATGVSWARIAARVMVGEVLASMNLPDDPKPAHVSVKAVKFPFTRFDNISYFLGPEMRSTGEVMGIGDTFGEAFDKAMQAVDMPIPDSGGIFISVNDRDKERIIPIARELFQLGFRIWATEGTCNSLRKAGVEADLIFKVNEDRPSVVDRIINGEIQMVINTPLGRESHYDEKSVGAEAYRRGIPNITTLSGASAAIQAIQARRKSQANVKSLQEWSKKSS